MISIIATAFTLIALGAAVLAVGGAVRSLQVDTAETVPAWTVAWTLERRRLAWFTLRAAACPVVAIVIGVGSDDEFGRSPRWVFLTAGVFAAAGVARAWLDARRIRRQLRKLEVYVVEVSSARDRYGAVMWETFVVGENHYANLGFAPGRLAPVVRAPAEERARRVATLVRGEITEGLPILVHLDGRWVRSNPAERGGLRQVASFGHDPE